MMNKVPNGWLKQSFGCIASFKNGLNFTKSDTGEVIKIVGVGDFKNHSVLSNIETLDSVQVAGSVTEAELLQSGDLLFVRSNGNKDLIGRCLYFPNVKERLAYSGFTIRGRVDNSQILSEYASYLMRSSLVKKQFSQNGGGTNISNLSQQILNDIVFPLPPLPEQIKIAEILSTWDNAINTVQKLLANSQQQKESLMQQLLTGKKRFAGFEGEWEEKRLGDLFSRVTTKNSEINTNVVTISAQQGLIKQEDFFSKSVASETLDGYFLIKKGQFAYNKSYSNGYPMGAIKRLNKYDKGVVTTLYICFELKNEEQSCSDFFEQFFNAGFLNRGLSKVANEGGRAHGLLNVKSSDFFSLVIAIPSFPEQLKIAAILTTADQEIDNLRAQLNHLKQEKKALMQQLLTGKRRVKIEEAA